MSAVWVFKEITLRCAGGGWACHHHKWIMMNNSGSGLLLLLIFALFVPVPSNRSPRASDWPVQSSDWSAAQPGLISPGQNVCLGYQVTWLVRPSHGPHRLGFLALSLSLSLQFCTGLSGSNPLIGQTLPTNEEGITHYRDEQSNFIKMLKVASWLGGWHVTCWSGSQDDCQDGSQDDCWCRGSYNPIAIVIVFIRTFTIVK